MSAACPHCQKELTDFVSKSTFDERVSKLSEKAKAAEERATKAEGLAKQAAPLAAKAHGYDFDPDTLETLQARYEKSQRSGYESDFASWLGDSDGAGKDPVASRFRAQADAPKVDTPKAEPKADPPKAVLPTSPTAAASPAVVRMTQDQIAERNKPLHKEYQGATPERRKEIRTEIQKNLDMLGQAS